VPDAVSPTLHVDEVPDGRRNQIVIVRVGIEKELEHEIRPAVYVKMHVLGQLADVTAGAWKRTGEGYVQPETRRTPAGVEAVDARFRHAHTRVDVDVDADSLDDEALARWRSDDALVDVVPKGESASARQLKRLQRWDLHRA